MDIVGGTRPYPPVQGLGAEGDPVGELKKPILEKIKLIGGNENGT
jgi:hypothetical protein